MLSLNGLCLCVADDLVQVIACHGEGKAIPVTELGATDLCVCHTLIVQMDNLRGNEKKNSAKRFIEGERDIV